MSEQAIRIWDVWIPCRRKLVEGIGSAGLEKQQQQQQRWDFLKSKKEEVAATCRRLTAAVHQQESDVGDSIRIHGIYALGPPVVEAETMTRA